MKHKHIIEHRSQITILEQAPANVPARVNTELLKRHDKHPVFAALRIGRIGAKSRNINSKSGTPRTYGRAAWTAIVNAINAKGGGIVGMLGHPDLENTNGFNAPPAVYWLEAKIEPTGEVGATAYFPPGAGRDHLITAKALGMPVATSLYAHAVENDDGSITDVSLEQLDLVLSTHAGLLDAVDNNFQLTMETKQMSDYHGELKAHGDTKQAAHELIAALRRHPDFASALYDVRSIKEAAESVAAVVDGKNTHEVFIIIPGGTTQPRPALESDYFIIPSATGADDVMLLP